MPAIEVKDFTTGQSQGSGLFEELMRSIGAQLQDEYSKGRINKDNYATVFLGSMQSAMDTASQFLLQYETVNQQLRLLDEQIQGQEYTNTLTLKQIELADSQLSINAKQLNLLDTQITQAQEETKNVTQGTALSLANTNVAVKQLEVLTGQVANVAAQTALVEQNTANALTENGVISNQATKLLKEVDLLVERTRTESAQTNNEIGGNAVGGILGKQAILLEAQTEGFIRDAEQKLAKIMVDTVSVRQTTDGVNDFGASGLNDSQIKKVIRKALAGIDVEADP